MVRVPAILLLLLFAGPAPLSAQTARLIITVADDSGNPLRDARVQLFEPKPPPFQRTLIASYVTDALGTVEATVDAFRSYEIRATHKLYPAPPPQDAFRSVFPFEGDVAIPFTLWAGADDSWVDVPDDLPPPPGVVKGRLVGQVVSATGEAVPDITVDAQQLENPGVSGQTRAQADGSYSLALDPGTYKVYAGGNFSVPHSRILSSRYVAYARNEQTRARVASGRRTRADIVLNPVPLFNTTVTVIDDLGEVVSGARVFATVARQNHTSFIGGETGTDGSTKLRPVPPGPVELLVQSTKDNRSLTGSATIQIENSPLKVMMTLVASGIITGRVEFLGRVDPLHGSDGLRVLHHVVGKGIPSRSSQDPSGRVSPNGDFRVLHVLGEECLALSGIPLGWRLGEITYDGQDYTYRPFSIESGQTLEGVVIRVEPGQGESPMRQCSR